MKTSPPNCAFLLPALAASGLLCLPAGAGTPPASTRAAIQSAYAQINAAFSRHDMDKFMTFFTPDYQVTDENGRKFGKEQTRKQYADQLKQIKTMQSRFTVQNFTATPAGVEADMTLHTQGVGEKRVLFMRLQGKYTDDLAVHDLWVQTPQGWQIKSRKTLSDRLHTGPA